MNDFHQLLEKSEAGNENRSLQNDQAFRRIWEASGNISMPEPPDAGQEWFRLKSQMIQLESKAKPHPFRWAVALVMILAAAFLIPIYWSAVTSTEFKTERGQRMTVNLPDRSVVRLNVATRLSYSRGFNKEDRTVYLRGEAFFDVEHGEHPFRIHTLEAEIEVLGTMFNVFAREGITRIGVTEGTVRVTDKEGGVLILEKGQTVHCAVSGFTTSQPLEIENEAFPAWPQGRILFDESPLGSVISEVERIFDIEVVFERPDLAAIPVSGMLQAQDQEQLLDALCRMAGTKLARSGETYIIR